MKKYLLLLLVIILFACSPKEKSVKQKNEKTSSSISKISNKAELSSARGQKKSKKPEIISLNGKWTNIIYNTEHDKFFFADKRSLEELIQATKDEPDNPDAWFALGKKYWNGYNEVAKAEECYKKALALAPDSLSLRVNLAEMPATQLDTAGAMKAFDDAYKYAKTDKEKAFWADNINYYNFVYKARGLDFSWTIDLLKKHADDNPRACAKLSSILSQLEQNEEAKRYIKEGLNSTTNEKMQVMLLRQFTYLRNYGRDNKNFQLEFEDLLDKTSVSPFNKLILKMQAISYDEREGKLPELCNAAAKLATNLQQRFEALSPLANFYVNNIENEKLRGVTDKILAGGKPSEKIAQRIFFWLKNSGDTNGAIEIITSSLSSETNEEKIISSTLKIATIGKDINEEMINKLVERFPKNGDMYAKLADIFKGFEWYDKEILYRERALKFLSRNYEKNAQAAELIKRYIKFDELDKAEKLLNDFASVLSNDANYTLSLSKIYLSRGRTNDAFELLMTNCEKMSHEKDRETIIKRLLTFPWLEKNQYARAARLAEKEVSKMSLDIRHERREIIYRLLIKSYIYLNEPDKALATCKKLFLQNGNVGEFPAVCRLVNNPEKIKNFVNEMLYAGSSQSCFYASAAAACENAMLPELALKLYTKAWKMSGEIWNRMRYAARAIHLADELKNYALRDEIVEKIIQKYKSNKMPYWSIWQISSVMKELNLSEKYEEMLKLVIEKSKGSAQNYALYYLVESYKQKNNKEGIKNLISEYLENKETNVKNSTMLIQLYQMLGENKKIQPIIENVKQQLTNSVLISRYGGELINSLCDLGRNGEAIKLVKKWLNDTSISINSKVNIIYPLVWRGENKEFVEIIENLYSKFPEGYNKENFNYLMLDMYEMSGDIDKYKEFANTIINSPNPRIWQIENIARFLKDRNLNAEALMAYDRVLEKMDDNNPRKFDILNRQAEIYIKTGNTQAAIECAKQSAAARPNDPRINSLLASAYRAAGDYKKALEEYCKGVKKNGNGYWQKICSEQIAEIIKTTDIDFDVSALAESLISENRTVQSLMTAAKLYSADDNVHTAGNLIKEALGQATINSQKAKIYDQWLDMVRKTSDEKLLDKTLREYFNIANNETKARLAREISNLTMKSGDYEKVIKEGNELLKKIKTSAYNTWIERQIQQNVAQAFLEIGDTESAWKTINQNIDKEILNVYSHYDWQTYMNFAREVGKEEEATQTLETFYNDANPGQKKEMLIYLFNAYKDSGRNDDIKKLITDADEFLKTATGYQKQQLVDFYKEAGETEKAIDILKKVTQDGNKWEKQKAVSKLFEFYKENNQLDDALEWAKKQPESMELSKMLAEIYREKGEYDKSIKLYEKLIESENIENWKKESYTRQLLKAAIKVGEDQKEKIVKKLIKNIKNENKGNIREELDKSQKIYQTAEMYDEALAQIKKLKKITKNKKSLNRLNEQQAECLAKTGEYDDAVRLYEKILQDDSMRWEDKIAYQNKIAKTYKEAHRSDEAKETAEEIVKICKEFLREHEYGSRAMSARFALADAYNNSGDKEAAREALEKIKKKYKNTSYAKRAEEKLKKL